METSPIELPPETLSPPQAILLPASLTPSAGQMTLVSTNVGEPPLNQPRGIAVGPNGRVYVADSGNRRLLILDQAGNLVAQANGGAEPFDDLSDVAVDSSGRVYALDAGRARLNLFDADGQFLSQVPAQEVYIGRSRGLFVDNQNRLWLANTPASRVVTLDLAGSLMAEFPVAPGMPAQPVDVAVTPDGHIFVTDVILDQLLRFGPDAQQRQSWIIPHSTSIDGAHLAVDADGGLYLTLPEEGRVLRMDATGQPVENWELRRPDGGLMKPVGIAVDTQGRIWVVDSAGGYIVVLTM